MRQRTEQPHLTGGPLFHVLWHLHQSLRLLELMLTNVHHLRGSHFFNTIHNDICIDICNDVITIDLRSKVITRSLAYKRAHTQKTALKLISVQKYKRERTILYCVHTYNRVQSSNEQM